MPLNAGIKREISATTPVRTMPPAAPVISTKRRSVAMPLAIELQEAGNTRNGITQIVIVGEENQPEMHAGIESKRATPAHRSRSPEYAPG